MKLRKLAINDALSLEAARQSNQEVSAADP